MTGSLPMRSPLLPCPFCGQTDLRFGMEGEHIADGYEVRCSCHAEMWGQTKDEAIANWNRRTGGRP